MSRKVEAEIQAQIDKMRKEYMTHTEYTERLLKSIDDLLRANAKLQQENRELLLDKVAADAEVYVLQGDIKELLQRNT